MDINILTSYVILCIFNSLNYSHSFVRILMMVTIMMKIKIPPQVNSLLLFSKSKSTSNFSV